MGARGPKPKATALKILEGNPGKRRLNEAEPQCHLPPVKPSVVAMDEIASVEWDRVLSAMPGDIYTALDVATLAQYALAWSMFVKAQKEIDEHGLTVTLFEKSRRTEELVALDIKTNPAVKVWLAAVQTLIKTTDRLGLSPGVRSRLQIPGLKDKPSETQQSKFAGLIGNTR